MLRKLYDENDIPEGDLGGFLLDTFKAVTKGVEINGISLDARADNQTKEYVAELDSISKRLEGQINNDPDSIWDDVKELDRLDDIDQELENDGQMFFDKSFDSRARSTSKILRRFGVIYNKTLRAKHLLKNKNKVIKRSDIKLFNRDLFESTIYNLAIENTAAREFIYNIENSSLEEIQSFNRYLDKVFPSTKLQMLNSMHFVLSNSKHIVGFRNTLNDKGKHAYVNSLSNREVTSADNVITAMKYSFDNRKENS